MLQFPNKIAATLRKIKEVWRQWWMVRYLYNNISFLAEEYPNVAKFKKDTNDEDWAKFLRTMTVMYSQGERRVERVRLKSFFVTRYFKEYGNEQGIVLHQHKDYERHMELAESILSSCIPAFIDEQTVSDSENATKQLVYINNDGKKFASLDGLLLAWRERIGPLLFTSGTGVVGIICGYIFHLLLLLRL